MCLLFTVTIHATADTTRLPARKQLLTEMKEYYDQELAADLSEWEQSNKASWMQWMPTMGISYTANGQPRPSIAFSLTKIYANIQQNQVAQNKQKSIVKRNKLTRQQAHQQLNHLYIKLQLLYEQEVFQISLYRIDSLKFSIYEQQFKNMQITPLQFLNEKKKYLQAIEQGRLLRREIELL
ncbi:MAG: hypothetical protein AAGG68_28395, partial [Bacteroidota bacterium]